jgi:spore germination protein GerM
MTARLTRLGWLALVLACAACSVSAERSAQLRDDEAVPFGLLEPEVPPLFPPDTTSATERVSLCFVEGETLSSVDVALDPPVALDDVVSALNDPPAVDDRALRTVIADPPLVREVRLAAGVARVDLRPAVSALGGDDQALAIAQVVCTLTARPGVGLVSFTLEGAPVDVPRGDGSVTSGAVSRDDYAELLG